MLFQIIINCKLKIIYDNLKDNCSKHIDAIGIWIYDENDQLFEIAMDIDTFQKMEKYGEKSIVPIYELFKMAIQVES